MGLYHTPIGYMERESGTTEGLEIDRLVLSYPFWINRALHSCRRMVQYSTSVEDCLTKGSFPQTPPGGTDAREGRAFCVSICRLTKQRLIFSEHDDHGETARD